MSADRPLPHPCTRRLDLLLERARPIFIVVPVVDEQRHLREVGARGFGKQCLRVGELLNADLVLVLVTSSGAQW